MAQYPAAWYGLWFVVAVCGVGTWYLRHFTVRVQTARTTALLGTAAMLTLLLWTWMEF
ncbi:MAG: hypothetical protein VX382_07580 [Candidatus Thermoplasmatota archaeon]|nr:hypothetical protein [Candidatus Thermoplasmatota archaeon]MEC7443415.1 hypothetical protein [Candidatus Thermoplasmatota archaeon]MEC7504202.1 hypothetical protein [Candidatus Thermoplasmatota archaeon]MEC7625929.1 hypothetical protein [Candidatus Thermoplasmatota archaeon]MEC7635381.1 hypothetical protein [Candidatus Thermoplasmatota archaeon]